MIQGTEVEALKIDDATSWLMDKGVLSERQAIACNAIRLDALVTLLTPTATDKQHDALLKWITWLFVWDDWCDSMQERALFTSVNKAVDDISRAMLGLPVEKPSAIVAVWPDLWQLLTPEVRTVVRLRLVEFFAASVWETNNKAAHAEVTIHEYRAMRPYTGGLFAYFTIMEDVLFAEVIDQSHPCVARLTYIANMIISLENDILSARQELQRGDPHNLVLLLARHRVLDIASSREIVDNEIDALAQEWQSAVTLIDQGIIAVPSTCARYIQMLQDCVNGAIAWHRNSARYEQRDSHANPTQPSFTPGTIVL